MTTLDSDTILHSVDDPGVREDTSAYMTSRERITWRFIELEKWCQRLESRVAELSAVVLDGAHNGGGTPLMDLVRKLRSLREKNAVSLVSRYTPGGLPREQPLDTVEDFTAHIHPHELTQYRGIGDTTKKRIQYALEAMGFDWWGAFATDPRSLEGARKADE